MLQETFDQLKTNTLLSPYISFIKGTPFATQYDKRFESEKQMLQRISIKFAILFFVIVIFDSLLDLLISFADLVIQLTHVLIEAIEYSLELLLTQILNTNSHQSETIIVNSTIIITLFLIYRLCINAPRWYFVFKRNCQAACLSHIRRESSCWRAMPLSHKIKWVSAYSLGTTCLWFVIG